MSTYTKHLFQRVFVIIEQSNVSVEPTIFKELAISLKHWHLLQWSKRVYFSVNNNIALFVAKLQAILMREGRPISFLVTFVTKRCSKQIFFSSLNILSSATLFIIYHMHISHYSVRQ